MIVRNSNLQSPTSREIPSTNTIRERAFGDLLFGYFLELGIWNLELGVCNFAARPNT
jgi:hypothetical protein